MEEPRHTPFSNAEALRFGWKATCANLRPLLVIGLAGGFLGLLQRSLAPAADNPGAPLLALTLHLLQVALFMALLRASLQRATVGASI